MEGKSERLYDGSRESNRSAEDVGGESFEVGCAVSGDVTHLVT
jgi:hypothetical protein